MRRDLRRERRPAHASLFALLVLLALAPERALAERDAGSAFLPVPELDVRVVRGGGFAIVRLTGHALRIESTAAPGAPRSLPLQPEERARLLEAARAAIASGDGPRTCREEELFVSVRAGEREASSVLCRGSSAAYERPWRRLMEVLSQITASAPVRTP